MGYFFYSKSLPNKWFATTKNDTQHIHVKNNNKLFYILFFMLTISFLSACNKPSSASVTSPGIQPCQSSPLLGSWRNNSSGDTLTFQNNCMASSSMCQNTFVYPSDNNANTFIQIISVGSALPCHPIGNQIFNYSINGNTLVTYGENYYTRLGQ